MSPKDADAAVKAALNIITESIIARKPVSLVGFGKFDAVDRNARTRRNPRTGEVLLHIVPT